MNELKSEDVMKALEHCANYKRAEVSCIGCPLYGKCDVNTLESLALALLREKDADIKMLTEQNLALGEVILKKDAEIERLKHSKGVAQVNIINEIATRMQIKEFNSHEIATGYSWAINDLLKLLLELKKKVMRGNKDDSN